ncbi:MAG: hypothetical protein K6T85_11645 [Gorillibacterium sp.]|nr:hypothetical protein [Gorillibacterium sp.]
MALEAAIALPFFLLFVLAMNCFIRLSVVESKLQSAATETVKEIATHFGPVDLLYSEAREVVITSKPGVLFGQVIDKIEGALEQVVGIEDATLQMEAMIPEPIIQLLKWEKTRREKLEASGEEAAQDAVQDCVDPLLNQAFAPIVLHFSDKRIIHQDSFRVVKVTIPDLNSYKHLNFGIEVEYVYRLPLPFINKKVRLKKRALERVWIGNR